MSSWQSLQMRLICLHLAIKAAKKPGTCKSLESEVEISLYEATGGQFCLRYSEKHQTGNLACDFSVPTSLQLVQEELVDLVSRDHD